MAYDDMWEEITEGVLLNKDHIVDADLDLTIVQVWTVASGYSVLNTVDAAVDIIFPAGAEVHLQTNATAAGNELQVKEIGFDTDSLVFKDTATACNGVLLRALKWDASESKYYSQNPSGVDADGNKGWIEVDQCAVIVAGPVVMKGITTTSTWSAALLGGISTD